MPFVGDLQSADVFLVLLNPGLGPLDYYGEEKNEPGYREALLANLGVRPERIEGRIHVPQR